MCNRLLPPLAKAIEELDLKRHINVWETPTGFPVMKKFPLDVPYYSSAYLKEYSHYNWAIDCQANLWTTRWDLQLDTSDFCSLLRSDCRVCGVSMKASDVPHGSVGCGVFSERPFGS